MQWNWDKEKAAANIQKHKVPFDLAALALNDPFSLTELDLHPDGDRWNVLCQFNGVTLFVVVAWSELTNSETGRIISARKATASERRQYDESWQS
ncbi:MAG: BrnT family toxin [Magnetococcus sp. YQC-5]